MDRINLGNENTGPRSFGGGAFDGGCFSPAPSFPFPNFSSVPAPAKPSTAAGLSKPRLAKVRKQFASHRVRPAVIADAEDESGFNPFRSSIAVGESDVPKRNEGGGLQGLDEKLHGWKPFDPNAGAKVSEDTKLGSFESVTVKHGIDIGAFVFGSGAQKNSEIGQSSGEEHAAYESLPTMRNVRSGNTVDCTYSVVHDGIGSSNAGVTVSGCGMKENANSGQNSYEDFRVPNFDNSAPVKSGSAGFVFGAGSLSNSCKENIGVHNKPGNLGAAAFGGGLKKSPNPCRNSAAGSNDQDFGGFEFGRYESAPVLSELNDDSTNIGSDKISGDASAFNDERSMHYDSSSIYVSASGLSKPQNYGDSSLDSFAPTRPNNAFVSCASSIANSDSKYSGSMNSISTSSDERSGISVAYAFGFGSGVRKGSNASENSFNVAGKGSLLSLHNEMSKLNLQTSGNEDDSESRRQADTRAKDNVGNSFVFGSNKTAPSSLAGDALNTLSAEMSKVSIGSEISSQNDRHGSMDKPEGFFVFGSNMKKSSTAAQTPTMPDKSFPSEILNDIQKLNIGDFKDDGSSSRSKDAHCQSKVPDMMSGPNDFIFAGDSNVSVPFAGSAVNTLHKDVKKLNIRDKRENSDGNTEKARDVFPNASAPSEHTFNASKQDNSSKESLFAGPRQNMAFSGRKGEAKGTRTKKRGSKPRQSVPFHQTFAENFTSVEKFLESKVPGSPDGYSPMDYSPYQENLVADQGSREASVLSDESNHIASPSASTDTQKSILADESEYLVSATQRLDITDDDLTHGKPVHNDSRDRESSFKSSNDAQTRAPDNENFVSKSENVDIACDSSSAAMETETDLFGSETLAQAGEDRTCFTFASNLDGFGGSNFTFGASSYAEGPLSASKRQSRRKNKAKIVQEMFNPASNANTPLASPFANILPIPVTRSSVQPDPTRDMQTGPQSVDDARAATGMKPEAIKDPISTDSEIVAEQEACEKWRLRGNDAYAKGLLLKAEECYTRGVNSVSQKENFRCYNQALMLCYSNRAAARLSLGRIREALSDCLLAAAFDSHFLRAQVRAANCYLALGEIDEAVKHFKKCLLSEHDGSLDHKILTEASDGLRKAQQVADYIVQSEELLLKRTSNEVAKALQMISESLLISTHSERLMEMKAEALLMLRRYEEVIQFCELTMEHAERSVVLSGTNVQSSKVDNSEDTQVISLRLWCWRLMSKSNFYLGRLEEALELLEKYEQVKNIVDKNRNGSSESSSSFYVIVRELLRLKAAGNEAFKEGRHLDAIEHYTAALACNIESRPFAAICFCNRAAAYQALDQITDAIADCSLAIALDASYPKAISRRATLHERIRDYGQASSDLRRLISLLEKQTKDEDSQNGTLERLISNNSDLCHARLRLSTVEEESRKEIPLDMYMILGIEPSCSAAEVKKAYRKAALRHHPDKAGQLLARSENLEDGLWREVAEEVHRDADRLFKMIGEAYTVLSDPAKRSQYDAEEEMRAALKRGYATSSIPKAPADKYGSQLDKNINRRQWQTYGSSHPRRSESSQSKR